MYSSNFLLFCFILWSSLSVAQVKETQLNLEVLFGSERLELDKNYYSEHLSDSIKFENIQFYLSKAEFQFDSTWQEIKSLNYKLIDLRNPASLKIEVGDYTLAKKIRFNLGIDSLTNVSGAFGDDLDPTNGMYWSWQSGYVNTKIEGTSRVFNTRKNNFQYHLGGYSAPFLNCQTVVLPIKQQGKMMIQVDLKEFFANLDINELSSVMSPSKEAVELSKLLASLFKIKQ